MALAFNNQGVTRFSSTEIAILGVEAQTSYAGVTYANAGLVCNASNRALHIRMGTFGRLFGRYKPVKLVVGTVPNLGTGAPGQLVIVYYANSLTPPPTSFSDATLATKSLVVPIWSSGELAIDIDPSQRRLLCRSTDNTQDAGPDYDYGVVYVFAIAPTAAENVATVKVGFVYDMYDPVSEPEAPLGGPPDLLARPAPLESQERKAPPALPVPQDPQDQQVQRALQVLTDRPDPLGLRAQRAALDRPVQRDPLAPLALPARLERQ